VHSQGTFLKQFYDKVGSRADWRPLTPEDVAHYDPRDYVAYIVADGDGMGNVFQACSQSQARALSQKMDEVLREALAKPTRRLMKNDAAAQASHTPVLPLILGGDDLFALVPAPWALDIARRLCRTFQDEMTAFVREEGITLERERNDNGELTITMSAAVVICKDNYPYYLAHDIGEERLGETKRAVKALAHDKNVRLSAVDFEVVLGSQVSPKGQTGKRRSTLRPYWVTDGAAPSGWGLSINKLLEWRPKLADTPGRRLSQLREFFDKIQTNKKHEEQRNKDLQRILARIERDWARREKHPVRQALEELGGVKLEEWYRLDRTNDEDFWQGHAMPDLLQVWDWALNLDYPPLTYEGGAR